MTAAPIPYSMPLKDAARFIGRSETTLRRLAEQGEIPFARLTARERVPGAKAGTWLFRTADLQAFVDRLFEEQEASAGYRS